MVDPKIEEAKAALRLKARSTRAAILNSARPDAAKSVAEHFFNTVQLAPGDIVAGYWRIKDEMDCQPILIRLMDTLQPVCLPVVLGDEEPLELRLWEQGAPLYEAGFGTLAPSELAPKVEPDIVLMPLLGFDKRGTRLGYGGGYYDRTLAALKAAGHAFTTVGIAWACGDLSGDDYTPAAHDVRLDTILTDKGWAVPAPEL